MYMMRWEKKKSEIYIWQKLGKTSPVWLPSHPPRLKKDGGELFSGVRKHRKQAGPTLGGTGALV